MALFECFTAAATISQQYIYEDTRNQLFIASIILGFIHLSFEILQFIYDPIKWFKTIGLCLSIWAICFVHAFYILLFPRTELSLEQRTNNNDPNNPWNLAYSYSKILDDGTMVYGS
ncbi:hypothetical protein C1645_839167 [Glomus cerebriforme]|uniref:Uncharacterized protein n=1 Tax=Glomus cerebriforme TaxID=658196 RepID=A0A397S2I0_9GLOM|nr:hypothetical protein C1645_839167 [Glomus cerebriforme]